jgi:hypothetical protein
MSTNNPRSRCFFFFDKKSMRYSNSALFVLLVLAALSIDPVWCLSDGPDLPSSSSSSLSSSSASSFEGLANEEPALAEGAPPPVIQGLPPNNVEADVVVAVDLMPRQDDHDEVTVDPPVQPPQIDDDGDDMNSIGPNSTDTEDESSEPLPSDPGPGGSSGPEAVVVVVNLVGWSLAAVGAMCLFYGVLRVSRRASAWAWGPSSAFPQPLFFADPPTPSSQLLASSNSGETGMVVVYTPQPLEDREPIGCEAECSASDADHHAYQKLGAIAAV